MALGFPLACGMPGILGGPLFWVLLCVVAVVEVFGHLFDESTGGY